MALYAVAYNEELLRVDGVTDSFQDAILRAKGWVSATGESCLVLRFYESFTIVHSFNHEGIEGLFTYDGIGLDT